MARSPPCNDASLLAIAADLRVVLGQFKRKLRAQGSFEGLTPSQVAVLAHLEREGPATVSHLARTEGMRPQSMGAIVAVLEKASLIHGTADPKDGRQVLLSLTPECVERIATARAARQDWLFRLIRAEFSPAEQKQLATGVALLKRITDL